MLKSYDVTELRAGMKVGRAVKDFDGTTILGVYAAGFRIRVADNAQTNEDNKKSPYIKRCKA